MFGRQQRNFPKRSGSGYSSWPESDSEDDMIRPCATNSEKPEAHVTMTEYAPATAPAAVENAAHPRPSLTGRRSSADGADLEEMWECMLELQQKYHCYNSTRMEIAADSDDAMEMMPTRACMDMLNDSIESLPEEGWKKLSKYLVPECDACQKPQKWKFWKHA
ncbi:hypothetical protein GCG54_00014538 [Colletotrichum gloeosporioides]|uniref:Uncharacterized protein n=1 Tax=Colletotrichum gloeosporioides TaxID=474922 RepID=A0A8H4CXR2_COLGL|nr:uncharacterized protein GCG54_00014538 [Colletotrichum gloeosporioides]KAF3811786.1 hypothetical protein GCG54_00014538 [Colletotrichum gloeosporioides]